MAGRIVGTRAIAEEVVQETFTRAWIHAPRWQPRQDGRTGFGGWLTRVATNLAIDQTRRIRNVPFDTIPEPLDDAMPADARLVVGKTATDLRALEALPPRQRAAIALTYDEGLPNARGAEAMAISVGAFELLLRARQALTQGLPMMEDKAP